MAMGSFGPFGLVTTFLNFYLSSALAKSLYEEVF